MNSQYKAQHNDRVSLLEAMLLVVIFVMPIWPRYAIIYIKGLPNINLTRILVFILIYYWIISLLGPNKEYIKNITTKLKAHKGLSYCLVLFFVLKYFSALASSEFMYSFNIVTDEFVNYFLLFLIGLTVWQTPQQVSRALLVIVASSLVVTLFGVYEAHLNHNILSDIIPVPTEFVEQALAAKYRQGYRIQSTFSNPLALAEYLVFIIPLAIVLFLKKRNLFIKGICFSAVILAFINIWKTESRGAIVVILVMGNVLFVYKLINRLKEKRAIHQMFIKIVFIPALMVITILSVPLFNHFVKGKSKLEATSSTARLEQLKTCITFIFRRPLLGYSPGQSGIVTTWLKHTSIDNYYLLLAMESGVLVLILFIYIFIRFIKLSVTVYNKLDASEKAVVGVLGLSLFGYTIFMTVLSLKQVFPFIFLSFAMILSYQSDTSVTSRSKGNVVL